MAVLLWLRGDGSFGRRQMRTLSILALIVAAIGFGARDAQAEGKYWPWCARYDGWTIVCGFATFQQCLATVSGVGGICQQNVMPPPLAEGVRYKRKRHARRHR